MTTLFGGTTPAQAAAMRMQEAQAAAARLAQQRSEQATREQAAETSGQLRAARAPRGQRLLIAPESAGLATTLGG